jgi:signal transduction histidine kinase
MHTENQTPIYGLLIFQDGRLMYSNPRAAELMACEDEVLAGLIEMNPLAWVHPDDRSRVGAVWKAIDSGDLREPELSVRLNSHSDRHILIDVVISSTVYLGKAADMILWVDRTPVDERQRRVEADVTRDILAALAGTVDMQQALEIILVNLHNLIHYDRVGLFLSDESHRILIPPGGIAKSGRLTGVTSPDNPLVAEFQQTGEPIIVQDVQADVRFANWPDMDAVRGWLGAPLMAGKRFIGFLSMGSLDKGAYGLPEAEIMSAFARQVADVLEKAWTYEQSRRNRERLEVLSNITVALGRVESRADTLSAIVTEVSRFFGASQGSFLLADQQGVNLVVNVSQQDSLIGFAHPRGEDLIWQVIDTRQTSLIMDVPAFLEGNPVGIYQHLCSGAGSAALIPLTSADRAFGVLCLAFEQTRRFSFDDIRLYDTVAEIAGTSLQRAVSLQTLERQVDIRTGHLSTLYEINAVAGEPLDLDLTLERVLEILLRAFGARAGSIHLLDEDAHKLQLNAQHGLPLERLTSLENLPLIDASWRELLNTAEPFVSRDVSSSVRLPEEIRQPLPGSEPTYVGAPIRVEGRPLGLLSVFGAPAQENIIESLALLMTIADQVGGYIERAGLIQQAEHAAVIHERQRLARELHDSVTQLLYSQVLFSGAGLKVLDQGDITLVGENLERIHQAALRALKEMRLLIYELRPETGLGQGLVEALERRLNFVERRTGVDVRMEVQGEHGLDQATQIVLFRIAEEALNNTLKHAEAGSVAVKLVRDVERFTLEILDDGLGFETELLDGLGGMGLKNMRARAIELGGEFSLSSAPGQGTRVRVVLDEKG